MKSTEYSRLVDIYAAKWKQDPRAYGRQLAWFSYVGVTVLILTVIISILFIVSLKLFLVILGIIILHSFAKAIFFKPEGVWGKPITRQMAPKLWEDVDEASRFLGAKKCDGVLVDYELNAAAVQFHRWGLVGPITNYVVLGIPLMDSMGREHIRSTLAHESHICNLSTAPKQDDGLPCSKCTNLYERTSRADGYGLCLSLSYYGTSPVFTRCYNR